MLIIIIASRKTGEGADVEGPRVKKPRIVAQHPEI
jgi:hypothetical protein